MKKEFKNKCDYYRSSRQQDIKHGAFMVFVLLAIRALPSKPSFPLAVAAAITLDTENCSDSFL